MPLPGEVIGGLGGLLKQFQQNGFGDAINSWIGTGRTNPSQRIKFRVRSVQTSSMPSGNDRGPKGSDLGRVVEGSSKPRGPADARRTFADPTGDFALDGLATAHAHRDSCSNPVRGNSSIMQLIALDGVTRTGQRA